MTKNETIEKIKELSDERAVKAWARLGMDTSNYLGAGLTKLKKLSKQIKRNHNLALDLYNSEYHDAKLLAVMLFDPKQLAKENIVTILKEAPFYDISDSFVSETLIKSKLAEEISWELAKTKNDYARRSAFMLVYHRLKGKHVYTEKQLEDFLAQIEMTIKNEKNCVKESMLYSLHRIGTANKDLHKKTIAVCKKIGKIEVDYGDTSCVTPDPLKYLTSDKVATQI